MQPRRKTLLYAGGLTLAVIALIADRAMRRAPQSATARETHPAARPAEPPVGPGTAPPAAQPGRETPPPVNSASAWLRELPDASEVRDLFNAANLGDPDFGDTAGKGEGRKLDPLAAFSKAHRLNATFRDDRTSYAIVDGRMVRPGQILDGFRLITVSPCRATFRSGRLDVTLTLTVQSTTVQADTGSQTPGTDVQSSQPAAEQDPDTASDR